VAATTAAIKSLWNTRVRAQVFPLGNAVESYACLRCERRRHVRSCASSTRGAPPHPAANASPFEIAGSLETAHTIRLLNHFV
jgi:hypothetical protein